MVRPLRKRGIRRNRGGSGPVQSAPRDYEEHFHAAASGYLVLAEDGTILDANRTLADWTGRRRDNLAGSNIAELLPLGDQVMFASHVAPQLAVAGSFSELAVDLLAAGKQSVPVLLSAVRSTLPDGATIDRVTAFRASERRLYERDLVSALRKAEAAEAARAEVEADLRVKLRSQEEKDRLLQENLAETIAAKALLETVVDTADVGLLVIDPQGNTVLANEQLSAAWRKRMGEVPVAGNAGEVFSSDRVTPLPEAENPVRRAAAGKSFSNQLMWFGAGDNQLALNVSARPIKTNGVLSGSVLVFHDVTRLAGALAAREEFTARVSHEIRTPLTSIMGYLDLALEDRALPQHLAGALNIAVRNSERLLALVTDVLAVASGKAKPEHRPVNLADVVRARLGSLGPKARAQGVDFLTEIPVSMVVDADPKRMTQAVGSLLSHAVKHSPAGGTVYVQLWQQGRSVCLRIADTGAGPGDAGQEKASAKRQRTRRTSGAGTDGEGLGVAISKNIIEEHGGGLWYVSTPGEGSVFTVKLPVSLEMAGLNR